MHSSRVVRTTFVLSVVGLLFCLGVLNCGHCSPVPTPVVDASGDTDAPKDIFYGITADCSLPVVAQQSPRILDNVHDCLGAIDVNECLVRLTEMAAKDTIVCLVQEFDMSLHASIAKGTATEAMKAEAAAASRWIRTEGVGIRN